MAHSLPYSFLAKKARILEQLSVPVSEYDDLSPKGSIDVGIRELIDEINGIEGCVTTSSCAGRVSVFLEGKKNADGEDPGDKGERAEVKAAGVGGKGGGGRWLFVSHDAVEVESYGGKGSWVELMGMQRIQGGEGELQKELRRVTERRLVHFKFEPMVYSSLYGDYDASLRMLRFFTSSRHLSNKPRSSSQQPFRPASGKVVL